MKSILLFDYNTDELYDIRGNLSTVSHCPYIITIAFKMVKTIEFRYPECKMDTIISL